MTDKILVPSLGESISEATVIHWYKKAGDKVVSGEKLVELETDKVNLDVGAERDGILSQIDHGEGDDVKVGDVLGSIEDTQESNNQKPTPIETKNQIKSPANTQTEVIPENLAEPVSNPQPLSGEHEKMTPVARRMAEEMGVDVSRLSASRQGGRITKQDIENAASKPNSAPGNTPQSLSPSKVNNTQESAAQPHAQLDREERLVLSRRRRTIGQRLVEAQHTAAMLTTFNDVDMTELMHLRQRRKEEFKQKFGVSLGITSFFVKASIFALKDFPQVNSELQGDELIIKHYYDIGIAIGAEEGLIVPVLKNADHLPFSEIEKGIQGFVKKSQDNTFTIEDLRGGTFSITNGGTFGSLLSTPILNMPQVAILGLHRVEERPVVVDGEIVIRSMMYLALSYDHRVIDGREAVQFLRRIKEVIESPERMLLEL